MLLALLLISIPDAFVREVELVHVGDTSIAARAEGRYKNGQRDGMGAGFWPDGARRWAGTYVAGKKHMLFMAWRQSGALEVEEMYSYGKLHGLSKHYADDGRTVVSETRYVRGVATP